MNEHIYYKHVDGGLYLFICHAKHADKEELQVVYEHVFPFERSMWVRNADEFFCRFKEISIKEFNDIFLRDPVELKGEIIAAKSKRRAEEFELKTINHSLEACK